MKKTKKNSLNKINKKKEKIIENYEGEKTKSLQKSMNKVLKQQDKADKLKNYNINKDLLRNF